jgi:RNA polymerase sigma-70 factor (ECF subfamily)
VSDAVPEPKRVECGQQQRAVDNPPGPVTPLTLLERARARDGQAWQQLVNLYRPLVVFWCRRAGLSGPDVEDLAQEVFASTALGLGNFRRERPGDTFRGWLRVITNNHILQHHRRNARHPLPSGGSNALQLLQEIPDGLAGDEDEEMEFGRVCRRVMEQVRGEFEEKTWQAFWLTVVEDRAPVTLTVELSMSTDAIRQAKSRILRRIKQELGELME